MTTINNEPVAEEPEVTGLPRYPGEVKSGDRADKVKGWQQLLKLRVNQALVVDGNYGPKTFHCVMFWQKSRPISRALADRNLPTGFMGEFMYHSLVNNLSAMSGDDSYDPDQPLEEMLADANGSS